jgi:hypothetical protein
MLEADAGTLRGMPSASSIAAAEDGMGLFSWLRGKPAAIPDGKAAKTGESREVLIRRAMEVRAAKQKEFDQLDPGVRARLIGRAMGKSDPGDGKS